VRALPDNYLSPVEQAIELDLGFKPILEHLAIPGVCRQCASKEQG
jgi:hypothetical protein